ncbi:MAG: hypothetical protein NVV74_17585 [Magnetospirillum sp.]|nr:hypothetical protein [Magnetospirillum sp.]
MATKTIMRDHSPANETPVVKAEGELPSKVVATELETAEDLRRRRAGIACFL